MTCYTTISCLTHDDIESSPITQEQIEEAAIVEAIICAEDEYGMSSCDESYKDSNWKPLPHEENSMYQEKSSGPTGSDKEHTARRRLFTDDNKSTDNDSKRKFLLDSLNSNMEIYKRQRKDLEKAGNTSSARRKGRRILQYKEAIEKVKHGLEINIDSLPDPVPDEQPVQPEPQINTNYQPPAEAPDTTKIPKLPGKKRNYCLFCEKLVKEYAVHIERHHADTEEGNALLSISEKNGRLRGRMKKKNNGCTP
ncbi:uncharacterized protein LOC111059991 [Nilaparvata lugens]|uniref:uncharacterized protein LOC111059991 n=1 Tax=Nilaparvata lugens TaxID=108931 RepID=UPI00193CBF11|nr:uncharacterized protein LOC111059991 [Nilaparvata lugens]